MHKKSPKESLLAKGLSPKKSFGQNFMMDHNINEKFAQSVRSFGQDLTVVEIGAGTGSLTSHLLLCAKLVHAVERDRDLIPLLKEDFKSAIENKTLVVHEADGVRFSLESIANEESPAVLVGNLPYHLSSSIFLMALRAQKVLKGAVFLVQKEVADRLLAQANSKDYGFLTVIMNLAFRVDRVCNVSRESFWPVPRVDSSIIRLTARDQGISQVGVLDDLIVFVRSVFQKRRKKLSTILGKSLSPEDFLVLTIDPNLRPENLSCQQFLALYQRAQELKTNLA
jgi:16S rRNA (adenine1518-N6/adenine1519-N6)-dimethyltransferase